MRPFGLPVQVQDAARAVRHSPCRRKTGVFSNNTTPASAPSDEKLEAIPKHRDASKASVTSPGNSFRYNPMRIMLDRAAMRGHVGTPSTAKSNCWLVLVRSLTTNSASSTLVQTFAAVPPGEVERL